MPTTRAAAEIGVGTIEFRQGDITEIQNGELGEFDYVIAHGVYAWVPPPVRDALLAAIHAHLAPDGLAFVSYNAHPGGYLRKTLREAGLWFAQGEPGAEAVATRAQELYRYLMQQRAGDGDPWGLGAREDAAAADRGAGVPARAR